MSSLYLAMQDALKEAEARKAASQNIKEGKEAPEFCAERYQWEGFCSFVAASNMWCWTFGEAGAAGALRGCLI